MQILIFNFQPFVIIKVKWCTVHTPPPLVNVWAAGRGKFIRLCLHCQQTIEKRELARRWSSSNAHELQLFFLISLSPAFRVVIDQNLKCINMILKYLDLISKYIKLISKNINLISKYMYWPGPKRHKNSEEFHNE